MTCIFCSRALLIDGECSTRCADGPCHTRCLNAADAERAAYAAECEDAAGFSLTVTRFHSRPDHIVGTGEMVAARIAPVSESRLPEDGLVVPSRNVA